MAKGKTPIGPIFETLQSNEEFILRLKQERQIINGATQLPSNDIDEMVTRKDDLEFQLSICRSLIEEGSILPFPFERTVILLHKAKRCEEELELCKYVLAYCANWKPDPQAWDIRESPKLKRIIKRPEMKHHFVK